MADSGRKSVKGRKGKLGRNKHRIVAYYGSGRYEHNRLRRLKHHLRRFPMDDVARKAASLLMAAAPLHISRKFDFAPTD